MKIGRDSGRYVPFRTVSVTARQALLHCRIFVVDRDELELVSIFFEIRRAHEPERVLITRHSLHQDVVILTGGVVPRLDLAFPLITS